MLTAEQITKLRAPLDMSRVKQRRIGGRPTSYLEGYDVIDQANELFGFSGWSYAVDDVQFVRMNDVGFYQAMVTVRVGDVSRKDVGCCDVAAPRDRGLEHASADSFGTALKGAVTDGLKRALRTFGNQFGNSLYDKDDPAHAGEEQAPVSVAQPAAVRGYHEQEPPSAEEVARAETDQACPTCGSAMTLRSGTTRDGRPYTAWFCDTKCGQKPLWLNERRTV